MKFLEVLDSLMKANGLNRHSLALKSGVPYTTIVGLYEKGCENVKLSTFMRIADCFGVTLDYLIYGESFRVSGHEKKLAVAYRNCPEMQNAVDTLLGLQENQKQ